MNLPERYILCIIVIYNPDLIILEQLLEQLNTSYIQIVLLDNSNCSQFFESGQKNYTNLNYERLHDNIGLPAAQNYAINKYLTNSNEFIIFFDQDSLINKNTIPNLLKNYNQLRNEGINVGAVGPLLFDVSEDHYYPVFSDSTKKVIQIEPNSFPVKVSFLVSSGLLTTRDVLSTTGLMNSDYFIDYSDIEWCFRLTYNKFEIYAIPSSIMYHSPGESIIKIFGKCLPFHSPYRKYYQARNLLYMLKLEHIPLWWKRKELFSMIYKSFIYLLLTKERSNFLKFLYRGIKDGLNLRLNRSKH